MGKESLLRSRSTLYYLTLYHILHHQITFSILEAVLGKENCKSNDCQPTRSIRYVIGPVIGYVIWSVIFRCWSPETTFPSPFPWIPVWFGQWEALVGDWRLGGKEIAPLYPTTPYQLLGSISDRDFKTQDVVSCPVKKHIRTQFLQGTLYCVFNSQHNGGLPRPAIPSRHCIGQGFWCTSAFCCC